MDDLVTVNVKGVYMVNTPAGPTPLVLLCDGDRALPIYVGIAEAISIGSILNHEITPRPMTHDLVISLLECLDVQIKWVLIDNLDDGVYYARLIIQKDGLQRELDARPSDCIALALRANAEVLVRKSVITKAALDKNEIEDIIYLD
ncbi:MAG: bifunctional nuclease family protein [Methanocellales archaeon]|nr:bifunctional nuclease family protein [Methanocellales archaeon]MDD3291792.1 bifunctional nuclease family protein [Methanocellales archaeon]MDD5235142.1 bifunctional nuclease family protein [Methanocellales archaeon]MDD5485280.1 bifunctional nuclease family protein [Methanocellales archaeon]